MTLDKKLLEILCCPVTKVPVVLLAQDRLAELNRQIEEGKVRDKEGVLLEAPVEEALITEDGKTIYLVKSSIPIMLEDKGIAADGLEGL